MSETEYKARKKRDILVYIENYRQRRRVSPSLAQIADKVNVGTGSLYNYYLKELIGEGWLYWTPGTARSLVPARNGSEYPIPGEGEDVSA